MHRLAAAAIVSLALVVAGAAAARSAVAPGFAAPEIATVVDAGLMAPSVATFRPDDPLTSSELATVISSLGGAISVSDPNALVSIRELDARLVTLAASDRLPRRFVSLRLTPGSRHGRGWGRRPSRVCSSSE